MSEENVEVVRRAWRLFDKGLGQGKGMLEAGVALYDDGVLAPQSTFTPVREVPGSKTYVGREGFAEFFRAWTEEWDEWTAALEEAIDAPGKRVVAIVRQSATGRSSGVPVENRFWIVYMLEGGQVVSQVHFLDRAEALEAAGLSE